MWKATLHSLRASVVILILTAASLACGPKSALKQGQWYEGGGYRYQFSGNTVTCQTRAHGNSGIYLLRGADGNFFYVMAIQGSLTTEGGQEKFVAGTSNSFVVQGGVYKEFAETIELPKDADRVPKLKEIGVTTWQELQDKRAANAGDWVTILQDAHVTESEKTVTVDWSGMSDANTKFFNILKEPEHFRIEDDGLRLVYIKNESYQLVVK